MKHLKIIITKPLKNNMEKQQTALEWFFDNLKNHEIQAQHFELYRQALDMEKQQKVESYKNGYANGQMDAFNN